MRKRVQDTFTFDPAMVPPPVKEVIFLRGTWYEMGVQYGQQAKDVVQLIIASKKGFAMRGFGDAEKAWTFVEKNYLPIYEKNIPEMIEFWKGVAESTGLDYKDVVIGSSVFNYIDYGCSTLSTWGSSTYDGRVLAGTNMDEPTYVANYDYAIICYPNEGNAVIANRGFLQNVNLIMNEKGVVVMNSAGQDAAEGDKGFGVPNAKPGLLAAVKSNTAEEAKDAYMQFGAGNGENCHVVDTGKNAYIVEHNARCNAVRKPGDFHEKDYMINCNGFFTEEMQQSIFQGEEAWTDTLPRYWTEEKILQDNAGKVTMDIIDEALGCTDTYIDSKYFDVIESGSLPGYMKMEDGIWLRDMWDTEHNRNEWTPENQGPSWKALIRTIVDPQTKEFFITGSCRDNLLSVQPGATGNYMRLTLEKTPEEVNESAGKYAQMMLYLAERDISRAGARGDAERIKNLDIGKAELLEGFNYQFLSNCAEDENDFLELISKSTSAFCRAQCYGQLAQDDPHKIEREGKNTVIAGTFIGG